jgi:hypothetical protein
VLNVIHLSTPPRALDKPSEMSQETLGRRMSIAEWHRTLPAFRKV